MTCTVSIFETEFRGHVYHVIITDQREYRKWQKQSGRSYTIVLPYEWVAKCDDSDLDPEMQEFRCEEYTKPSKKRVIESIEHYWKRHDAAVEQKRIEAQRAEEAKRLKEEQERAYEEWLDQPAQITHRQLEAIMQRLTDLESKLERVAEIAEDVDWRTSRHDEDD